MIFSKIRLREICFIEMDIEGGDWLRYRAPAAYCLTQRSRVSLLVAVHPELNTYVEGSVLKLKSFLQTMGFCVCALTPTSVQTLTAGLNAKFWWIDSHAE